MLLAEHIAWYKNSLEHAKNKAEEEIAHALRSAKNMKCAGCTYCLATGKHKAVVEATCSAMNEVIDMLVEGMRTNRIFAKYYMSHDSLLYRGFILEDGSYVGVTNTCDHSAFRKRHAEEFGEESAYKLINIHSPGPGRKTKVIFCDRKGIPTQEQLDTLKQLMIDAEGSLEFSFQLDTNHPTASKRARVEA